MQKQIVNVPEYRLLVRGVPGAGHIPGFILDTWMILVNDEARIVRQLLEDRALCIICGRVSGTYR